MHAFGLGGWFSNVVYLRLYDQFCWHGLDGWDEVGRRGGLCEGKPDTPYTQEPEGAL